MPKQWVTDRSEMEAILNECDAGSMATVSPDGSPYIVTVNHVYHNGKIYFHCALKGKKLDNIVHEPRVCFEVHKIDRLVRAPKVASFSMRYRSVIAYGRARVLNDQKERHEAITALIAKYTEGGSFDPPDEQCMKNTAMVEIEIDEMTGKKNVD